MTVPSSVVTLTVPSVSAMKARQTPAGSLVVSDSVGLKASVAGVMSVRSSAANRSLGVWATSVVTPIESAAAEKITTRVVRADLVCTLIVAFLFELNG